MVCPILVDHIITARAEIPERSLTITPNLSPDASSVCALPVTLRAFSQIPC